MAPQAWFIGPVCGVDNCRSRRYVTRDGLTICQLGHVADGNIELNNEEEDVGGPITRRLNMVNVDSHGSYMSQTKTQSQGVSTSKNQKLHGKNAFDLYLTCLQILLKKQYEIIVNLFFREPCHDLLLIVKTNWIKVLNKAIVDYEKKHNFTINNDENLGDIVDDKVLSRIPNLLDILSIIYLSILQLRYKPVYLCDFYQNIISNTIPYAKTIHLIPENHVVQLLTVYQMLLQPSKVIRPGDLDLSIRRMAGIIYQENLLIPIDYYYPFILNTIKDTLIMPNSIDLFNLTVQFCHLLDYIPKLSINKFETKDLLGSKEFPEIYISSIIIFIIKTNYLFKFTRSKKINPILWLKYFELYDNSNNRKFYTRLSDQDLLNWSDEQTEDYLNWIHDEIVPKQNHTSNGFDDKLTTMEKQLFRIFNYDTKLTQIDRQKLINPAPEIEKLTKEQAILNMVNSENYLGKLKITPSLINQIESKIIDTLSETLGVSSALLLASYHSCEKDIRDRLILSKINESNGSTA